MRSPRIATRRAVLLQAWRVAQKRIESEGIAQLAVDEEAGRLLAQYESANVAYAMCQTAGAEPLLAEVVREEGGAVMPRRS